MEKLLLSFSNNLRDIKKVYFAVFFLFSTSFVLGQAPSVTTNKTITANATNCGVIDVKLDITGANPSVRNSDIILSIDVSGSMGFTITGDMKTSMDYAKEAALAFVDQAKANPQNRIAIVAYSTTASLKIGLTFLDLNGVNAVKAQINALQPTNSTNIYAGIKRAETELEANGRFDCSTGRSIILLTDGVTNVTGNNGNTDCDVAKNSQCVTDAINAATDAKVTTKNSVVFNNQVFAVGLFGGISGNINTEGSDRNVAKYTLDKIQGSEASITNSGANLTAIYNQIATQLSWVAQSLIEKETVIAGFTISGITTTKGTASAAGQVITWNTDFLNAEKITLTYQLTPTGSACGTQTVSTSTLNYKNSSCSDASTAITSPSYFVPCAPTVTGVLNACGTTTLTANTNATSPTYVWYKDNVVINGETNSTLVVTVSGAYKVKVKNGTTNCELTSAPVNVTISPAAALVAPQDATIEGCSTAAITGLAFKTTDTTITLAQLTTAGGSISNSANIGSYTLSYSDVATGTCPIVVTRTFKVVTSCGTITKTQTITVQDKTAPTWTTGATALNVTLECTDSAGLATAQANAPVGTDNCGGTVAYTKSSGTFQVNANCASAGTYTNTWIATDVCNNSSATFTQIITIQDKTGPTWTTVAGDLNVTLECTDSAGLTAAQGSTPVATDGCGGNVSYTKSSGTFVVNANCANAGTYTNTWVATDRCNNTSTTFTQVITIEDKTGPNWTTAAGALNVTLECTNSAGLTAAQGSAPVATDGCGGNVSYTKSSGAFVVNANCANAGTYTNTWVATDRCSNTSSTFTQVITIEDKTGPNWTTAAGALNVTLECTNSAGLTAAQGSAPVATDGCGGNVSYTKSSGTFVVNANCANAGTYTNTWVATDRCNNTSTTFTQVITIEDKTGPKWTTSANALNVTLECTDSAGLTAAQGDAPVATDECGGNVSYTKSSGTFVVNANCANAGTYTNTWVATDRCNNTSTTFTQVITIEDKTGPKWTTAAGALNVTLECTDSAGLTAAQGNSPVATDECGGNVTYTKSGGTFQASANCANAGTYTNTWVAKDRCNNSSTTFTQVITIEDKTGPKWTTSANALNVTLECSDTNALNTAQGNAPVATDECGGNVSYTKSSGTFVVNANCANAGTYTNTWVATDRCNNTSTTFTQVITIQDTTAPKWTTVAGALNVTLQCSDTEGLDTAQSQTPVATDNCGGTVTYTKTAGLLQRGACGSTGTYTNTWVAKDVCNNTSTVFTQVITIQDSAAPKWVTIPGTLNVTLQCNDTVGLNAAQNQAPTASANCTVVTYTKTEGPFVPSQNCANEGTYTNSWIAKDDCGNTTSSFTQVITIEDTIAPIFTGDLPSDITVSCDAVPAAATLQVSDNCSEDLPIVFSEVKSDVKNECGTEYTLTRKWTTSDCAGNTTTHTQVIIVRDTTPPTGTAPADVANLQSIADIPPANPADITDEADNCNGTVKVTVSDSDNGASGCDGNAYILTRTYTLTDCAGNKTELVQTFTVDNKVSVSGVPTNVSCLDGTDGSILVTSSPGSTVVITNANNEVVGNTNLPAGTYTLTATSSVNGDGQTCTATATVTITQPNYKVKISGHIINVDTNTPIANVPVTLIPQGTTPGPILIRITGADGAYSFSGMVAGDYLVQVQDANLNSAYQLYPVDSSLFFTTLEECKFQVHDFLYGKSDLPVLGDYVWYDTNSNGIQDEWYDANNDGVVTKNIPDSEGAINYSQWEWLDLNGDGSYTGPQNAGELNAGGFGNALSPNVFVDGPNGYHAEVIIGIQGFWRNRPESANPYGEYKVKLVKDANFDAAAAAIGATGLVKVLPSITDRKITSKTGKTQMHTVCTVTSADGYIVNVTPEDLVHLDIDFGVNCKDFKDIVANDDSAGPFPGVNHTTPNVLNVLTNDTLEGAPITAPEVIITTVTPNEFLQLNPDGSVDILPNAPVGTLTMVYQICEADATSNCDTATVTITIEAPTMTVTATSICVNDVPYLDYVVTPTNFTPINGVTIAWADSNNNVVTTMTDLPLSGRVLWPGAVVDQAGNGVDWPGWVFQDNKWIQAPDGFEGLRPTANVTISVNPSETITVNYPPADPFCIARPTFEILANDDNAGPVSGLPGIPNVISVYTNDTLNGDPVNPSDLTLTTVTPDPKGALTLNPDGTVSVAPNTPNGTYTLTYQICENADAGNCDTAIVTVIVSDPLIAGDDTYDNIGCGRFGLVGNVLSNDVKGNVPVTLELVNFTLLVAAENSNTKTDPNITVDALGNVRVPSLTPAGTYNYTYQICDKLSPESCAIGKITIIVAPNAITRVQSTSCTDDSTLVDLLALLPADTPRTGVWVDTNNTNTVQGNVFNPFGLALGTYLLEYRISDENCPRTVAVNMTVNDDCKVLECGNVVVHNAFSPNGDGINDVFVIDSIGDLTCYPGNTVEIYNRWGILVFETTDYNNTTNAFDGTSRGRTTVKQSDGLPTGTYFYIVTYKSLDGNNVIHENKKDGYLYLSK
ncbi:HYR-like domain-containing protein [Flavobacterium branchiicola]|uniref:Gliding motility-associated C-terminal domain-containing protein n=1 Tax=Flavobacterium branchiicola TaxID=1114875 RepID=A0ABV9PDQ9_9FLAO|nr:gliding motility-associated C-terminal domain-containing protein [Flavobacterium branchiicola]MBS7254874.1 gliding motility-associated C-terminal domain-containing protein [Flavobacterium branchiicola]